MLPARCNTIICQHNYFQRKYFQRKYCQHKYLTPSLKLNIFAIVKEMRSSLMLPLHTAQVSNVVKQLFQTQLFSTQISYNFFKAIYFCNCSGNEQLFDAHCTLHRFPTLQHNYFKRKYFQRKYLTASLKPNIFATVEEMSGPLILPAQVSNVATQSFVNTIILNANISNRIMVTRICFSQNRHFANTVLNNYHLQLFGKWAALWFSLECNATTSCQHNYISPLSQNGSIKDFSSSYDVFPHLTIEKKLLWGRILLKQIGKRMSESLRSWASVWVKMLAAQVFPAPDQMQISYQRHLYSMFILTGPP